ncbi:MAG: CDP-alcohol phosphatidyltransferase family protein [Pseudomonadota bacterium]
MITNYPQQIWKEHNAIRPPAVFVLLAIMLLVGVYFGSSVLFGRSDVSVGLFVLISAIALRGLVTDYPHKVLGLCNGVTLARAALTAILAGAVFVPEFDRWAIFVIAFVAFAMDGLDGWLARKADLSSAFGARFDMEVDAVLSALLATILLMSGRVGPEVLLLGFMRYGFVALSFLVPRLKADLPPSFRRKAVCVIQIATLLMLLCPLTPTALLVPATLSAALLLVWSFAVDARWLLRMPE